MTEKDVQERWFMCGRGHNFKAKLISGTNEKIKRIPCPRCDQIVMQVIGVSRTSRGKTN
jgi:hypothetical protein